MKTSKKAIVLGAGFAGMAGAALLAKNGLDVTVIEKNTTSGGRGRVFEDQGYRFDMGPSWYWMPDVYEQYYNEFGYTTADFYELKKLDPGFAVIFGQNEVMDIPADFEEICTLFETFETGAGEKLRSFIADGAYKYQVGMGEMVFQPAHSILEFMKVRLLKDALKLQLLSSFRGHVREYFKDPRLLALMEFPVLFLGALPKNTPAMYSLMNFAGLKQGTFYPMGGFGMVAQTFQKIAEEQGVDFKFDTDIHSIQIKDNRVEGLQNIKEFYPSDVLLGTADYAHIERMLLPKSHRSYPTSYWDKRTFAPSALIFYLGINKKLEGLRHHNLFFEESFDQHAHDIYKDPKWPKNPLFYACCPSRTDDSVAPAGKENLFMLMPLAIGLADSPSMREEYFEMLMERLEKFAGEPIREFIDYKKSYCINNFINDYNAYKGNAYGLANTLRQTAFLKPKMRSQKVSNLYYAGQLTVPGPGVPPTIISGQIAAKEILKHLN